MKKISSKRLAEKNIHSNKLHLLIVYNQSECNKMKYNSNEPNECHACNTIVLGGSRNVIQHLESLNHKRLANVFYLSGYFSDFSLDWDPQNPKLYYCDIHKINIAVDCRVLLNHIAFYHSKFWQNDKNSNSLELTLPLHKSKIVHKSKIWLSDFPKKFLLLNEYCVPFELI